jgi:rfaE bifunctional protein nucleotidyltransferase chain/domain
MKTVFTCGVFDLYHIGHLNFLKESKSYGDKLIVGINTDEFTLSYKKKRPIIPFEQRFEIVNSCKYVDFTVKAEEYLPLKYIKQYNINVITVGSDWKNVEIESIIWAKNNNVKVIYINYTPNISTSYIVTKIKEL